MMRMLRTLTLLAMAAIVAACTGQAVGVAPTGGLAAAIPVSTEPYRIAGVSIRVPQSLLVSEANMFFPIADIVWRGEPRGDRHAQVQAIYAEAMGRATANLTRGRAVLVDVEVTRFHCLTEKTRYTVGGTHSLHFILTLRDAATGAIIEGPRAIIADVKASGGSMAVAEDAQGLTQRVVVVNRLAQVLAYELTHHVPLIAPGQPLLSAAGVAAGVPAL